MDLIEGGDILIGLPSSGPHSNGYSLLRKIVSISNLSLDSPSPFNPTQTLGESLLTPTKLYIKAILPLVKKHLIKAMAHITGGGFLDNIPRVLPKKIKARIDAAKWSLPEVFKWAKEVGNVEVEELARTFNCGIGMVLVVAKEEKEQVLEVLKGLEEEAFVIGALEDRAGSEEQVVVENMQGW